MHSRLRPYSLAPHDANRWWRWSEKLPPPLQAPLRSRFFRFLMVGGLNTLFGYGVFAALILLGVSYPIAALLATVLGVLFNFKSYGRLVFDNKDNSLIFRYAGVYTISYAVSVGLLALGRQFGLSVLFTAGLFAFPLAGLTFWLNRSFVFQSRSAVQEQKAPSSFDI